jgi:hypothetical protein
MDPPETDTHSFIVTLWLEETEQEAGRATWRGHITHVPTGTRRYLSNVREIIDFITPYLKRMGVKLGVGVCGHAGFDGE